MENRKLPWEEVTECSLIDYLLRPRDLTEKLTMPARRDGKLIFPNKDHILSALETQVGLAKRKKRKAWLRSMAFEARNVIGADRAWVLKHFVTAPTEHKRPPDSPSPVDSESAEDWKPSSPVTRVIPVIPKVSTALVVSSVAPTPAPVISLPLMNRMPLPLGYSEDDFPPLPSSRSQSMVLEMFDSPLRVNRIFPPTCTETIDFESPKRSWKSTTKARVSQRRRKPETLTLEAPMPSSEKRRRTETVSSLEVTRSSLRRKVELATHHDTPVYTKVFTNSSLKTPSNTDLNTRLYKTPICDSTPRKRAGRRKSSICGIAGCTKETSFPKLHLVEEHLPLVFSEKVRSTEEVTQRRYACLVSIAKTILGPKATLHDVQNHFNNQKYIGPGWEIIPVQKEAMLQLCRSMGWAVPDKFSLSPINSPAALLHWRCLQVMSNFMTRAVMEDLRARYTHASNIEHPGEVSQDVTDTVEENEPEAEMEELKPVVFAYDSHFHADRLAKSLGKPLNSPIPSMLDLMPLQDRQEYILEVSGGIANFCDPEQYPTGEDLVRLVSNGYRAAIGVHPKKIASNNQLKKMEGLLRSSAVIGLGEVGLDHSVSPENWYPQEQQLRRILHLLDPCRVLVLHLRGSDRTGAYVYRHCLDIIKEFASVTQRIQLHCFSGDSDVVDRWLRDFPETHFSSSGMCLGFGLVQKNGLRRVPEGRLLLETDAPYFPLHADHKSSAPHMLDIVAKAVANIRGDKTMEEILEISEANAKRFFHN